MRLAYNFYEVDNEHNNNYIKCTTSGANLGIVKKLRSQTDQDEIV